MESRKYIIAAFIALVIQLLIGEFVNIWPPLYITVIPLFIIILPLSLRRVWLMIIAFAMGLITDVASDGIAGLNAASLTLIAYLKNFLIRRLTKYSSEDLAESIENLGRIPSKIFFLIFVSYFLFFILYIILDGTVTHGYFFHRLLLNVVVNTLIGFALERLWIRKLL